MRYLLSRVRMVNIFWFWFYDFNILQMLIIRFYLHLNDNYDVMHCGSYFAFVLI